jgi:hypothetical protein
MSSSVEKVFLIQQFVRLSLFALCMVLLTETPAHSDLPYILEPPFSSSIVSFINITGHLDFCGEPVPLDNQTIA